MTDDFEPDDGPDAFDELDKVVELARRSNSEANSAHPKHYTSSKLIQMMIEEVTPQDIRTYQQIGGGWVTEVSYRGLTFITVTEREPEWEIDEDNTD